MTTLPITLTADELSAAAGLAGCTALPAFWPEWTEGERGVAAAVAVRGLLARGLAESHDTTVRLNPGLRLCLEPIFSPSTVVEVVVDSMSAGTRRTVAASAAASAGTTAILAAEGPPLVWRLSILPDHAVVIPPLPGGPSPVPGRHTIPADLLSTVESLLIQHAASAVPALLERSGVDGGLAPVLVQAQTLTTVRLARRLDRDIRSAAAVSWLDAGSAGLWLVTLTDEEPAAYVLEGTTTAQLRDLLAELLRDVR